MHTPSAYYFFGNIFELKNNYIVRLQFGKVHSYHSSLERNFAKIDDLHKTFVMWVGTWEHKIWHTFNSGFRIQFWNGYGNIIRLIIGIICLLLSLPIITSAVKAWSSFSTLIGTIFCNNNQGSCIIFRAFWRDNYDFAFCSTVYVGI